MVVKHNLLNKMSDKDLEPLEAIIPEEELDLEDNQADDEDIEVVKANAEKATQFAKTALARAKKAEAELKEFKTAKAPQLNNDNKPLTTDEIDERVLRLQGMSEAKLEALKKVAKVAGKTLMEAQSDEVYKAMESRIDEADKSEKAKLGASRNSGSAKKAKSFNTPGLSDEDHKSLWRESQGR